MLYRMRPGRNELERLEPRMLLSIAAPLSGQVDGPLNEAPLQVASILAAPPPVETTSDFDAALALEPRATTLIDNGPTANRIDIVTVGDGYTFGDLDTYASHVANFANYFFTDEVIGAYAGYFNLHVVEVISDESGVDNDPTQGISRSTALDMTFWAGGIERLLGVNVNAAWTHALLAPEADQVFAIANSTKYGGAGYTNADLATFAGGNASSIEIALHEFGHSFAGLADEYYFSGAYTGPEPHEPNVTTLTAEQMIAQAAKWYRWLDEPGVGLYEGGLYKSDGVYRPTQNSKMRSLGQPWGPVNAEQLIISMYEWVDPIDAATAAGVYDRGEVFFVDALDPLTHDLDVQWLLDGQAIVGATGEWFDTSTLNVDAGTYTLSVEVVDNTDRVRDEDARALLMTGTRQWTLNVVAEDEPDIPLPPSAGDDIATVNEDGSVIIDVLSNDVAGSGTLMVTDFGDAAHGTVRIVNNGTAIRYTPGSDYFGGDSFSYVVTNTAGLTDSATVSLSVIAQPDAPQANDDLATLAEDAGPVRLGVLDNDTAAPDVGQSLRITAAAQGGHGRVVIASDGSSLTYQPDDDFFGNDSFTYTVTDDDGLEDSATVLVTVEPRPDAPTARDDAYEVEQAATAVQFDVLANDTTEPDGPQTLIITSLTQPTHGTVSITHDGGALVYEPDGEHVGEDIFAYTVTDSDGLSDTAVVTVTVLAVDDPFEPHPPLARDDFYELTQDDGQATFAVLANDTTDPDTGQSLSIISVTTAAHGSAIIANDGSEIRYTPNAGYFGVDAFSYMIIDDDGLTDTATVTIDIQPRPVETGVDLGVRIVGSDMGDMVVPNEFATISVELFNAGAVGTDAAMDIALYFSADQIIDDTDALLARTTYTGGLIASGSTIISERVQLPQTLAGGDYRVLASIAAPGMVDADVANNTTASAGTHELAWVFGDVPGLGRVTLKLYDETGERITFTVNRGGYAVVDGGMSFEHIGVYDTNASSNVKISSRSSQALDVHGITVHAPLSYIAAQQMHLRGPLIAAQGVEKINLGDVTGAMIDISAFPGDDGSGTFRADLGRVTDSSISSAMTIRYVNVVQWRDTDAVRDTITAPVIQSIRSDGDFEADIITTAAAPVQTLGRVTVGGTLREVSIRASGDIGKVKAAGLEDTTILAGAVDSPLAAPAFEGGSAAGVIGLLKVKGPADAAYWLTNSALSARAVGTLKIGFADEAGLLLDVTHIGKGVYLDALGRHRCERVSDFVA